ncbi:guanine deaminase isoform X1 [Maniola hyperantus]|uniref:guanine deaminase isoform X1 n=1 Tax=Aphantopus hyperantus TaxID=2795564 RepID=UPI001568EB70|nr:guanine deaminase [Maniola hyperantus]
MNRSSINHDEFIIVGDIVSPISLKELQCFDGYIQVKYGKIIEIGTRETFTENKNAGHYKNIVVGHLSQGQFLLPGFVDCHTHAPQFPNLGLGLDRPLLEWLDKYTFPLENKYSNRQFAANVYEKVVKRLLNNGTTTACYFGSLHLEGTLELVKSVIDHKQRALVGKVSMNVENNAGYFNKTVDELRDVETFVKNVYAYKNNLVEPIITPRFALSCDSELMGGLAQIAKKYQCATQSHISENKEEIEFVLKTNPVCSHYTEVYDRCEILNNRCIMAHAVYLSECEMSIFARKGVSVAHCPASNTRLQSGLCPVRTLLDHNVCVGLGTDVSGGDSTSILDAMRRAMDVSEHLLMTGGSGPTLDWKEALYLATVGGAKALGLQDKIGAFEVGKSFDALVIDVSDPRGPIDNYTDSSLGTEALVDLAQKFVYCGDDRNIVQVYVNGEQVKHTLPPYASAATYAFFLCE